jgi:methylphosphotriester-DNA--protein-cysteine methyltransferase
MMIRHADIDRVKLRQLIDSDGIRYGGNARLKIYGTLQCTSGKTMMCETRVFFVSEDEAVALGFRPCGHCMREKYKAWRNATVF